jgi:polar amino acid transport system substrate-binding protein
MTGGRRLALLVALVGIAATATGCDQIGSASGTFHPNHPGTLTVMTQPLPTRGFWEGEDSRADGGLEYGIALDLAKRFGLDRVVVRTNDFSRIVDGRLGDADIALALITPTAKRDEVLDFTTPYIDAPPALVVRVGTEVPDVQTAQELRWAVGTSTTFEDIIAQQIHPDDPPKEYENRNEELAAILADRADVAMFDLPAAVAIVHADTRLTIAAKLLQTEPIAAALPDGSQNTEAVSAALRAMENDGTLDQLAQTSLGVSLTKSFDEVPLLRTVEG